ncbi:hypothetical protein SEVIR_9G079150v4 [Setaria viridis]
MPLRPFTADPINSPAGPLLLYLSPETGRAHCAATRPHAICSLAALSRLAVRSSLSSRKDAPFLFAAFLIPWLMAGWLCRGPQMCSAGAGDTLDLLCRRC